MKNSKLAIFTPLPPTKSGIADYSIELGAELSKEWDVTFVIDDKAPEPIVESVDDIQFMRVGEWNDSNNDDVPRFYQMGNNVHHEFVLTELRKKPGVTLMHDFSMHHLLVELTLAREDKACYQKLLELSYGEPGKKLAQLRDAHFYHGMQEFLFPLNDDVILSSKGLVVHSISSMRTLQFEHPNIMTCKVPFPYQEVESSMLLGSREQAKRELKLEDNKLIITSFGFVTPPKQIEFALKALAHCKQDIPDFEYVLVGEVSPAVHIEKLVAEFGLEDNVRVTGFVSFKEFHHYIEASDLVISLRYPSAGETSAALMRAMGMSRANIVFNYASYIDYPDDTVIKIPLDTLDIQCLVDAIKIAANNEEFRNNIAERAGQHLKNNHRIDNVSQTMSEFIKQCYLY